MTPQAKARQQRAENEAAFRALARIFRGVGTKEDGVLAQQWLRDIKLQPSMVRQRFNPATAELEVAEVYDNQMTAWLEGRRSLADTIELAIEVGSKI